MAGNQLATGQGRSTARWSSVLAAHLISTAMLAASPHVAAQPAADEAYVEPLLNQALETERTGVEVPWSNPATGSSGIIVIERTFYRDPRTPCRDYRRTLERAGAPTVAVEGTGCRVGSGRWTLDEEPRTSVAATPTPVAEGASTPEATPAPRPLAPPRSAAAPQSCPTLSVVPVPCTKPPALVDYTLPTRTRL